MDFFIFYFCFAGAMEKEAKEWGNKEQRATLSTLRNMFPQVSINLGFVCLFVCLFVSP